MLSNAYFLAKFRFDTAENEPAKNLQNLLIFPILLTPKISSADLEAVAPLDRVEGEERRAEGRHEAQRVGSAQAPNSLQEFVLDCLDELRGHLVSPVLYYHRRNLKYTFFSDRFP